MADRWWQNKPDERYWLEATDREDIGADLKAPDADASGLLQTLIAARITGIMMPKLNMNFTIAAVPFAR